MSFDLLFFKNKDENIVLDDVVSYFENQNNFKVLPLDDNYYRFIYRNKETRVVFVMTYNETNELISDQSFDEHIEYCYMYFTINLMRPSFFAYEAMNIVEAFINTFHLYIYDIQSLTEDKNTVKSYTRDELIQSYIQNNNLICQEYKKSFPLLSIEKEKTDYFYSYVINKEQLATDEMILPDIFFIKNINDESLHSVFSFDDIERTLIPKCDFVLVLKQEKGFLGIKKKRTSLIPYQTFINQFKHMLEPLNDLDLYVLNPVDETKARECYENLPQIDHDKFDMINVDEIVDVDL